MNSNHYASFIRISSGLSILHFTFKMLSILKYQISEQSFCGPWFVVTKFLTPYILILSLRCPENMQLRYSIWGTFMNDAQHYRTFIEFHGCHHYTI